MTPCHVCGNHYDKAFTVSMDGVSHTFDCFECAINALAPRCAHCNGMIIGHGVESDEQYFCCAHCAHEEGVIAAVPGDVDEADQRAVGMTCRHPAEAVRPDLIPPPRRGFPAVR